MNHERCLKIIQCSKHKWRVEGPKGNVLTEDLTLNSKFAAEDYIKAYISSFNSYYYVVVPLEVK